LGFKLCENEGAWLE